jgi:hypothetical protein
VDSSRSERSALSSPRRHAIQSVTSSTRTSSAGVNQSEKGIPRLSQPPSRAPPPSDRIAPLSRRRRDPHQAALGEVESALHDQRKHGAGTRARPASSRCR